LGTALLGGRGGGLKGIVMAPGTNWKISVPGYAYIVVERKWGLVLLFPQYPMMSLAIALACQALAFA
jgi:hypothetical protein